MNFSILQLPLNLRLLKRSPILGFSLPKQTTDWAFQQAQIFLCRHLLRPDEGGGAQAGEREQRQKSLLDVPEFIGRAAEIYRYKNFICDSGGSLCEVVDVDNPDDTVLKSLSENTLLLYIEGTPEHAQMLVERFRKNPKPMYYQPQFLNEKWAEYKTLHKILNDDDIDPDGFAVWGFEQLLHHRIPLYKKIADQHGYTIRMRDIPTINTEADFVSLLSRTIDQVWYIMPIRIPDELPARRILEQEGVSVMTEATANRQDIRPLRIALLNLMPRCWLRVKGRMPWPLLRILFWRI